jgi:diacylglycerol kinase
MWLAICGERSFHVHLVFAVLVIVAATVLQVSRTDWCILLLCITIVFAAEMFNTALEHLAKAVDRSENRSIGTALEMGSAAVLLAAIGAVVVGCVVFALRFVIWWQGDAP